MIPIRNKRTRSSLSFILFVLFVINVVVMNDYVESFVISLEKTISSSSTTTLSKRQSFPLFVSDIESQSQSQSQQQQPSTSIGNTIPTLSSDTTWMIRITLRNIKTQLGQTISNQMYVVYGKFISLENYEPPQGTFQQQQLLNINSNNDTTTTTTNNNNGIQITSSRWILSEDPNDRKDGLWIWGLFQQPLYPFMLLSFETKPIPILNNNNNKNENNNEQDYIPALQLYVQLDHTCNRDTGAVSLNKRQSQQSLLNMDDNVTTKVVVLLVQIMI